MSIMGLATFTHFALWLMNRYFHSFDRFITSTTVWLYSVLVVNLYTGWIIQLVCTSLAWHTTEPTLHFFQTALFASNVASDLPAEP